MKLTKSRLEPMIDASIGNKPAPMLEEFRGFVKQTSGYGFAVTLAEPYYVKTAAEILHPLGKKVCTVLSYPLAGMTHETKMLQARTAIADGADELDISMDLSLFLSGRYEEAKEDMKGFVHLTQEHNVLMKMIYFASRLSADDQKRAAQMAVDLGIPFLKTNPGFGAVTTPGQIRFIKQHYAGMIQVMASGGVRTAEDAMAMVEAGADRIATSTPFRILEQLPE